MKIAIDAMGGDYAPGDIVRGAVIGAREYHVGIILVGPGDRIQPELAKYDTSGLDIEIVHTDEYLVEGEQPAYALRTKRNASIALATRQVKEGKAQAVIGVGPTGGVVAAALTHLGTVEGISRPVVGGAFLGFAPKTIAMDLGGNVDCRPDQLLDFAVVGTVYARKMFDIANPSVALLNVGVEEGKGNEQAKAAYQLLKQSGLNFIGNIEGIDVPSGKANVIICDGFVGNVMAKFSEGLGRTICKWLEDQLKAKLPENEIKDMVNRLFMLTSPSDVSGGGPIFAVNGVVFKAHGRSRYPEVARTVGAAKWAVEADIVGALKAELARARGKLRVSNP
ncbi:MAG: phosphate acyltransferase PlsX [Dehalococcoidia bacterium]|nr:phosphate acyltransferase PlsX [Dehalococcoidia bacterium]